jgi:hypothetical protein
MGATCSSKLKVCPQHENKEKIPLLMKEFRLLSFSKNNVNDLFVLFNLISGSFDETSVHEALVWFDTCQSLFVEKIFGTMCKPNGCFDFEHFVFAVWSFCSFSFVMLGKLN